jgi:hypothetical protein
MKSPASRLPASASNSWPSRAPCSSPSSAESILHATADNNERKFGILLVDRYPAVLRSWATASLVQGPGKPNASTCNTLTARATSHACETKFLMIATASNPQGDSTYFGSFAIFSVRFLHLLMPKRSLLRIFFFVVKCLAPTKAHGQKVCTVTRPGAASSFAGSVSCLRFHLLLHTFFSWHLRHGSHPPLGFSF